MDSDSSLFSWKSKGVRHPNFPNNYIKHIQDNIGLVDIILVSSHDVVRTALEVYDIPYTLVYPDKGLKDYYIERYKARGNEEWFIKMVDANWDTFIDEIEKETFPSKVTLQYGQYLSDIMSQI